MVEVCDLENLKRLAWLVTVSEIIETRRLDLQHYPQAAGLHCGAP